MTVKEIRKKIAESDFSKELNSLVIEINYPHLDYKKSLIGLSSIYEFVLNQKENWIKIDNLPDNFKHSKELFVQQAGQIFTLTSYFNLENQNNFNNQFNNIKARLESNRISSNVPIYPIDTPETKFLLEIYKTNPNDFIGAFDYLSDNRINSINDKNYFNGLILGFEFYEKTNRVNRVQLEKKELNELRNLFNKKISDSEHDLSEHFNNTEINYKKHLEEINVIKEEKNNDFNNWFESIKNEEWKKWYDDKIEILSRLEKTYETNLKLEKPARYWEIKSTKYFQQGNSAKTILIWVVSISSLFLSILLFTAPDWIFQKVFKGNEVSIVRWSIVFVTLISLLVYAIRALTKYMFSSYHLARDAEERHTLTFFYLALLKDTEVNEEDRKMILQSLFSRTDTGLLKEDSSPTLPGGIFEKFKN